MFVLQIHSVTFFNPSHQTKLRNVFLDISNENQPSRRYFVGRFSTSSTKSCESIIHISKTPITLHLSYGPLMYHDLGPQTIYDFLYEDKNNLGQKKFLTFGRRGPLYHVCYSISPVKYSYGYSLNRISCLKQITSLKDELYAEVEFNHSPQSIGPGPTNRYHLGSFVSHDITEIHSVHNLTFSTLVNFVLTFYIKTSTAEYILGTLKFTPIHEINSNFKSSLSSSDPTLPLKSQTEKPQTPQIHKLELTHNFPKEWKVEHADLTQPSSSNSSNNNNSTTSSSHNKNNSLEKEMKTITNSDISIDKGGLYCYRSTEEKVYTFLQNESTIIKKITLTSTEGRGSYEFVFTLSKTDFMMLANIEANQQQLSHKFDIENIDFLHNHHQNTILSNSLKRNQKSQISNSSSSVNDSNGSSSNNSNIDHNGSIDERDYEITTNVFNIQTEGNQVEVLIDGLQTFRRYYEIMMNAQHSISILAWELSFSFGLVLKKNVLSGLPMYVDPFSKWITLEDVLITKVLSGVNVRIIVWRHELLSHLTRFLYLGEVTIEREVAKLERRCKKLDIVCNVFHTTHNMPGVDSTFANIDQNYYCYGHDSHTHNTNNSNNSNSNSKPKENQPPSITVIIVGNPQGILSSHHEKLLLVDAECPDHCVAFTGGFDIARGRYDQPLHQIPKPYIPNIKPTTTTTTTTSGTSNNNKTTTSVINNSNNNNNNNNKYTQDQDDGHDQDNQNITTPTTKTTTTITTNNKEPPRYSGRNVQPLLRQIRFLWHDIQILLRGPSTQHLRFHFYQRWIHAFSQNISLTRNSVLSVLPTMITCTKKHQPADSIKVIHSDPAPVYEHCSVRLFRTWKGVLDTNMLFDDYGKMILNAKKFLYIEHQYPFQNFTLTYYMCEALKANPKLHLLIVTPVKTDLPSGLVGELFDWSQDHIIKHLHLIQSVAPDRVGIYGLVRQDAETSRLKPIYIHSKLFIVDDLIFNVGSTNMDNMSFFHSSELCASIIEPHLARDTRVRLAKEHLGSFYTESMSENFLDMFNAFKRVSDENFERLRYKRLLIGRPVSLAADKYEFLLKKIYYPSKFTKLLFKMGLDTEEWLSKMFNPSSWMSYLKPKL